MFTYIAIEDRSVTNFRLRESAYNKNERELDQLLLTMAAQRCAILWRNRRQSYRIQVNNAM